MELPSVGAGAALHKEVVAVLNGYLPRHFMTNADGSDLYLVEEWKSKHSVVLKISKRQDDRIRGELFYWGMISCINVVELSDLFFYDDSVYFVCPHFSNGSLHDILSQPEAKRAVQINELLIRKWTKQSLIFLHRLHTMGLYHLNIRKKTLFVDRQTNLKVGGLGYVTLYNDRYATLGRMDNIPPEALELFPKSSGLDLCKVDMWAVGALIMELLTGQCISGPYNSRNTLADRLNRRLIVKQNISRLSSLPNMNKVSRGGKNFVTWLLKWEPSSRPSARQALKHPWLRDQDIKLELYQLDRLLNKVTGRAVKIVPQLSLVHPVVPLIPPSGSATVRPRLLARTEIVNRRCRLGLSEDRVHLSKHAWSFREHVLKVDPERRAMWLALYDMLITEGIKWHWEPPQTEPGHHYRLPTRREKIPSETEKGDNFYSKIADLLPHTSKGQRTVGGADRLGPQSFNRLSISAESTHQEETNNVTEEEEEKEISSKEEGEDVDGEDDESAAEEVSTSSEDFSLIEDFCNPDLTPKPSTSGYMGSRSSDSEAALFLQNRCKRRRDFLRDSKTQRLRRCPSNPGIGTTSRVNQLSSTEDSEDNGDDDEPKRQCFRQMIVPPKARKSSTVFVLRKRQSGVASPQARGNGVRHRSGHMSLPRFSSIQTGKMAVSSGISASSEVISTPPSHFSSTGSLGLESSGTSSATSTNRPHSSGALPNTGLSYCYKGPGGAVPPDYQANLHLVPFRPQGLHILPHRVHFADDPQPWSSSPITDSSGTPTGSTAPLIQPPFPRSPPSASLPDPSFGHNSISLEEGLAIYRCPSNDTETSLSARSLPIYTMNTLDYDDEDEEEDEEEDDEAEENPTGHPPSPRQTAAGLPPFRMPLRNPIDIRPFLIPTRDGSPPAQQDPTVLATLLIEPLEKSNSQFPLPDEQVTISGGNLPAGYSPSNSSWIRVPLMSRTSTKDKFKQNVLPLYAKQRLNSATISGVKTTAVQNSSPPEFLSSLSSIPGSSVTSSNPPLVQSETARQLPRQGLSGFPGSDSVFPTYKCHGKRKRERHQQLPIVERRNDDAQRDKRPRLDNSRKRKFQE